MSAEVITIIIAAASLLVTMGGGLFAGLAWVVRHMDTKLDKIGAEIGEVRTDLNDVKVSVARLEGPHPPLFLPR